MDSCLDIANRAACIEAAFSVFSAIVVVFVIGAGTAYFMDYDDRKSRRRRRL